MMKLYSMKSFILSFLIFCLSSILLSQTRTIHVFVVLCDNEFQGIAPVPERIGNGKDPIHNLYWGAGYGVKSYFKNKTKDWILVKDLESDNPFILDRVLFKHANKDVYLLADAYDGEKIKMCIEDFLEASNGQNPLVINVDSITLNFGGGAQLQAFIGHDGLMDFEVNIKYNEHVSSVKDVIVLGCYSKEYFSSNIKKSQANPILWTTHLMAPEAYSLKSAIDGWMKNETGNQINERAAQTYNHYQHCGINGARNLFTSGF